MTEGAFYSATDADSEGEEGKFFVWTPEQVAQALDNEEDCRRFCAVYDITKQGNWEHKNIPNRMRPLDVIAQELQVPIEELQETLCDAGEHYSMRPAPVGCRLVWTTRSSPPGMA